MARNYKVLNIKGAILDKYQLEYHIEKIATDHILQNNSCKSTYPIPRLEENFEVITQCYNLLNEHVKLGILIHPAGEWILDNYYIIEETVKTIKKELSLKKYTNLLGLANSQNKGFARIYVLASEILAYTDNKIDSNILKNLLNSYQNKKTLTMEEIWNIGIFLQISIIENIREICEKIYLSQIQKYKVENIIERLIENKDQRIYTEKSSHKIKIFNFEDMKYSFIEYMSYKLKSYGKQAYMFLNALEEQVEKMGMTVSEVIKKEHFAIAVSKVSMANCIKSMKNLLKIDFLDIFEAINGVEEILNKDPAQVYTNMDYKTKIYYRNSIKEISKKTKISEIYIAKKVLELASREGLTNKETHIGYYLISDGIHQLQSALQVKFKTMVDKQIPAKMYISSIYAASAIICTIIGFNINIQINNIYLSILSSILIFIPVQEIVKKIIQYILGKTIKSKLIPKLYLYEKIPPNLSTMVVIPTIVKDAKKVNDIMKKLEVYYLANKSDNIYFALLGDSSSSKNENEDYDEEVKIAGLNAISKLNEKYSEQGKFPKFSFIYRKRKWNQSEKCFLGWERKRGLLNQFNEYILGNEKNDFKVNSIEEWVLSQNLDIPKIKYIITLDADTDLVLNTAFELIGAMAHILNIPVLDENKNIVVDGYGLIQPRVGVDLEVSRKSLYTKIFAGSGGTDSYSNAISDIYQDTCYEGIFTGKGIYDLEVFSKVLRNEIPENTVLSHDLLEGSYLRCGLATDILLLDGYPSKYNSNISRIHRWIRGDWQIIGWLKKKVISNKKTGESHTNPLNLLSRYKIFDNLVRSLLDPIVIISLLFFGILKLFFNIKIGGLVSILLISSIIPLVIDVINYIIFKNENIKKQKSFNPIISGIYGSFLRSIITLGTIPYNAYISINAITKTIYRMCISKQNLLEWTTAEDAEKMAKSDLGSYYKNMVLNVISGILLLIFTLTMKLSIGNIFMFLLSILWSIAPMITWYISKEDKEINKQLTKPDIEYVKQIALNTWKYFSDFLTQDNNYLPPDNLQENRIPKLVDRTSSTNIGLAMVSIISAYDLKFINIDKALDLLGKIISTVVMLPKWNGHLYNWYNIKTLKPLIPRYISSVDSGNFIGYLYVTKQFLIEAQNIKSKQDVKESHSQIDSLINVINDIINATDFSHLYCPENRLFSIGFNVEENKLTDSYYDLLASEARQASLIAIAKKDVPAKHWQNLSRTLTILNNRKGLISWSGTSFEYLMPNINIKKYPASLLDESSKFMIMSQIEYSKKLGIPWGISESAFNLKDLKGNYQYKSFGIPWLGLKRGLSDEIVVSSYGTILAITEATKQVIENLKKLEKEGMYGEYGFYESIDYTPTRVPYGKRSEVIKMYMAHHQSLILLSINNLLNNNILQQRFSNNPEIQAVDILLQERMPENMIVTKEKKEKPLKLKYVDYQNYSERVYTKPTENLTNVNVISNDDYTICVNEKGEGFSSYKNIFINRFKETHEEPQGIFFYLKNIKTKRIWTSNYMNYLSKADKYEAHFMPDVSKFSRIDGNITTTTKITIAPNENVEIRRLELYNNGNTEEILEITSYLEPVLSHKFTDYAHRTFNNLFLTTESIDDTIIVKRRARSKEDSNYFLGVNLYTEDETVGDLEFEIDKDKFMGRGNLEVPKMIKNSLPFSKSLGLITEPVIALRRTIKLKPGQEISIDLIISISEDKEQVINNIKNYKNNEKIKTTFELSRAKAEAESRYLRINSKDISNYQKILSYLIFTNPLKSIYINKLSNKVFNKEQMWKLGISCDLPILLVKIQHVNDIHIIEELIKAHEYFRVKNIEVDLVILNEEKYSYEQYIKDAIDTAILNVHLGYLRNTIGGIHILNSNELSHQDIKLLELRANLTFDAHMGSINTYLEELEEEYFDKIKNIGFENTKTPYIIEENVSNTLNLDITNMKYYNEYGGFSQDGTQYIIQVNRENKLPTVWSHIMSNESFGTLTTENMGGFTWYKNSRLNRLSSWGNNSVADIPSEIIYIKDEGSGVSWTLGEGLKPDNNDYVITYGFGFAKYNHNSQGILQELEMFVPKEDSVKINLLKLKNTTPDRKKLKLLYYVKPVLGEDEISTNGYIDIKKENNSNLVVAQNLYSNLNEQQYIYIFSNENIKSYTGNKNSFIGMGTIQNPDALYKVSLDNENSLGRNSCIAIELTIDLEPFENKETIILLGAQEQILDVKNTSYKYSKVSNVKQELDTTKKYWSELLGTLQIKTPLESMNILLNGWAVYQTIVCRLWARSGFYQSGGATGFRDQLQDTLAMKYINPEFMRRQIIKHSKHQFIEGDVLHWWHDETEKGIRTRFSDDLLWLAYTLIEYIEFTNDYTILDIKIQYLEGDLLPEGIDEKYEKYLSGENAECIYMHAVRAIEKSLDFGENNLPKIGSGDWNDGFNTVGNKGRGESIWLGFFIYDILNRFIPICKYMDDQERANRYEKVKDELKKTLNQTGWDGRWFKRAITDDGDILGSLESEECRIDSISQSWSVISNAGDNDKKYISMESLENHLVDRENGIIKLLDPPFDKSSVEPGYIKAYIPGVRENGGQYTHAATWAIIAETLLGFGDKALEYFKMINPIEHARTKEAANKYKVEPYVISGDVYGTGNLAGRGGWTWYTGSSSWMYKAGIEYILGLKIRKNVLSIEPCIPKDWKEYSIRYKYKTSIYNIKVKNLNMKNTGIEEFIVNGEKIEEKQIKLIDNGRIYEIEVIM